MAKPKQIRCAIYTRKSTEEGLEQEFNSLDAQREACAAYILSQRHEGWSLSPSLYDDGGFSGGNMERPGLKQLLADIALGKIDVIVVYKVDRLTRSLTDFSKIVDVLDKADASFVSVTQSLNSHTSMGRLMLNVLLSFAQFEREVTGERIRDKIAASRRKGMWMGGPVPLGYDLVDRKLLPNPAEAATVRLIFERYLALGSVRDLVADLDHRGIRSKERIYVSGRNCGGVAYRQGALSHMLRNPLYIGEVRHKGERFNGEHAGIVDHALWDRVQAMLSGSAPTLSSADRMIEASLLAGMIADGEDRPMTPSHSVKRGRRYRYYITRTDLNAGLNSWRVPAAMIDTAVLTGLQTWLGSGDTIAVSAVNGELDPDAIAAAKSLAATMVSGDRQRQLLQQLGARVTLRTDGIELSLDRAALLTTLDVASDQIGEAAARIGILMPARLTRRGCEMRLAYPAGHHQAPVQLDPGLIRLLAEAERAHTMLTTTTIPDASKRNYAVRLARLKFLAPDIVSAILAGRQPVALTRQHLIRAGNIPFDWEGQRRAFGFKLLA
jgi:site-specific DNA recombinase